MEGSNRTTTEVLEIPYDPSEMGVQDPRLRAEDLTESAFAYTERRDSLGAAWWPLERAIATPEAQDYLDSRIEESYAQALEVSTESAETQRRMQAQMLIANLGLLAIRSERRKIKPDDVRDTYFSMAEVTGRNLRYGNTSDKGILAEMVTFCLIARAGDRNWAPYVGSPREERSSWQKLNHDLYTLGYRDSFKVPVQVKYSQKQQRFDFATLRRKKPVQVPPSYVLEHYSTDFIKKHAPDYTKLVSDYRDPTLIIAELISKESDGLLPEAHLGNSILNSLTAALVAELGQHRQRIINTRPALESTPQSTYTT